MYWFTTFPNEPDHPLHEEMVDFETVTGIVQGKVHSQLPQMSRIYKMMLRYSERKAKRFLRRFPSVYWAPDNEMTTTTLCYSIISKDRKVHWDDHHIVRWAMDPLHNLLIQKEFTGRGKEYKILQTGREFNLFYDENAWCSDPITLIDTSSQQSLPSDSDINRDSELYAKHIDLRKNLNLGYSWQQEAHPFQVKWMKDFLSSCLKTGVDLYTISNIHYEIWKDNRAVGDIMILEYKIYLTIWPREEGIEGIFEIPERELKDQAARENIQLICTNSL